MSLDAEGMMAVTNFSGGGAPGSPVLISSKYGRCVRTIQNVGSNDVYLSADSAVTTTGAKRGFVIKASQTPPDQFIDASGGVLYLTAGGAYDVCVVEVYAS